MVGDQPGIVIAARAEDLFQTASVFPPTGSDAGGRARREPFTRPRRPKDERLPPEFPGRRRLDPTAPGPGGERQQAASAASRRHIVRESLPGNRAEEEAPHEPAGTFMRRG